MIKLLKIGLLGIAGYVGYKYISGGKTKQAKIGSQMGVGKKKGLRKKKVAPRSPKITEKVTIKKTDVTPSDVTTPDVTRYYTSDSDDSYTVTNKKETSKKVSEPTRVPITDIGGTYQPPKETWGKSKKEVVKEVSSGGVEPTGTYSKPEPSGGIFGGFKKALSTATLGVF